MDDEAKVMNITELLTCAEGQGLGILSRGLGRKRLIELVFGDDEPQEEELCGTVPIRDRVTYFIRKYRRQITLPPSAGGKPCDGDCTSYGCPTVISINCSRNMSK
jgi:hypothetical protein